MFILCTMASSSSSSSASDTKAPARAARANSIPFIEDRYLQQLLHEREYGKTAPRRPPAEVYRADDDVAPSEDDDYIPPRENIDKLIADRRRVQRSVANIAWATCIFREGRRDVDAIAKGLGMKIDWKEVDSHLTTWRPPVGRGGRGRRRYTKRSQEEKKD